MERPKIEVITTDKYDDLVDLIRDADLDTLVIFDVDEVLIQPKDELLKIYNVDNMANLFQEIKSRLSTKQSWELESIILREAEYELVNTNIRDLIREIQGNGIKVIALTQLMTGEYGRIKSLVDWRLENLKSLGYNLNKSWKNLEENIFNQLPSINYPECSPVFKEGVVFTCDHSKDTVLNLFLEHSDFSPRKIVFIDDMKKHIDNMRDFASANNLAFKGVIYTESWSGQASKPHDEELSKLQLKTLENEHKWLSDQEAKSS